MSSEQGSCLLVSVQTLLVPLYISVNLLTWVIAPLAGDKPSCKNKHITSLHESHSDAVTEALESGEQPCAGCSDLSLSPMIWEQSDSVFISGEEPSDLGTPLLKAERDLRTPLVHDGQRGLNGLCPW
jgi:hypothetical protein